MSYRKFIIKTWDQHILTSVLLELTYQCNLDCVICYNDRKLQGTPLSKDDYFRLLEDLAEMQVLNLTLSGGEPLAHPDFWAIGRRARELGFVVRVKSNGHALGPTLAKRLKTEIDPFNVDISLHGATAATHDRQTRVPGSFDRLLANLKTMQALGLRIKLNCPLTVWNEGEIEIMFAIADSHGVRLNIHHEITPRDDGDAGPLALSATAGGQQRLSRIREARLTQWHRNTRESDPESRHQCGAGSSTLTIDPMGNVLPCVQWRRPVGNLHEQSIAVIWSGSAELGRIRQFTEQVKRNPPTAPDPFKANALRCPANADRKGINNILE